MAAQKIGEMLRTRHDNGTSTWELRTTLAGVSRMTVARQHGHWAVKDRHGVLRGTMTAGYLDDYGNEIRHLLIEPAFGRAVFLIAVELQGDIFGVYHDPDDQEHLAAHGATNQRLERGMPL